MLGVSELLLSDPLLEQHHRSLVAKSYRSGEVLLELVGMVLVSLLPTFRYFVENSNLSRSL